jgi:hypothetical protein
MNHVSRRGFLRSSSLLAASAGVLREPIWAWGQDPVIELQMLSTFIIGSRTGVLEMAQEEKERVQT